MRFQTLVIAAFLKRASSKLNLQIKWRLIYLKYREVLNDPNINELFLEDFCPFFNNLVIIL